MVALSSSGRASLDQLADKILQGKKLPNVAFGATSVDQELYFTTGGSHIVGDSTSAKVAPDSVFWLCSQTKLITHVAALKLIDQGKLKVDTPVSEYIPELANPVIVNDLNPTSETPSTPATNIMTIKHLLNFSSGLFYPDKRGKPENLVDAYCQSYSKGNAVSEFISYIKCGLPGVPIQFEPGTSFAYGWNSDILGFVIEKVSGVTLEQFFQDNIFKPLGVKASFYLTPDLKEKHVDLSFRTEGTLEAGLRRASKQIMEQDPEKLAIHLGGVGLYASLRDYLTILRHLLQINAGKAEKPILSKQTVQSLFEGALTENGSAVLSAIAAFVDPSAHKDKLQWSTGLAVCTSDWPNRRRKGTVFWGGWANTNYWMDPTTGVAAVFGTQLVPPFDPDLLEYYAEFENVLYAGLTE